MNSGVLFLFFDIPQKTNINKNKYSKFIKEIKKDGFIRIQESIFYRQIRNIVLKKYDVERVRKASENLTDSNIKILTLTTKEFENMINISGNNIELDKRKIIIV